MKKKIAIVIVALVGVTLLTLVLLPALLDANKFRPVIESHMRSALGREVQIGRLKLSLLSGGIRAEELVIADDPAFSRSPFLRARSLTIGADLLPLILSGSMRVRSLTIEEPQIALLHSTAGKWNFSSFGSTSKPPSTPSGPPPEFSIHKLKIVNGRVIMGSPNNSAQRNYEEVNVEATDVSFNTAMPFTVSAKTPGGGSLKVAGWAGPVNRSDAAQTPLAADIHIEHMDLASTGFLERGSALAGLLNYSGNIKSDGKTLHAQGIARAQKLRLVKGGGPARQPVAFDYASDYDLKQQSGALTKGDLRVGSSVAKIAGNYDIHGQSPVVHMRLNAENMPISAVEGLLPAFGVMLPAGSSLQGGTATAKLALDGPIDRLLTSGPVNINNARLAGFNIASKLSALAALAGIHGGSDTMIENLSSKLRVSPEGVRADDLKIAIPALGNITGSGIIAANNALNFKMLATLSNRANLLSGISTMANLGQGKNTLPFLVQGTTANPIFVPDVMGGMKQNMTAPPQGVGDILGGIFGKQKQ